jgi:hypothetical protein
MNLVNVISNATPPSPGTSSSPAGAKVHFHDLLSALAEPPKPETIKPGPGSASTPAVNTKKSGQEKSVPVATASTDSKANGDAQIVALATLIVPAVPVPSPIVAAPTISPAADTVAPKDTADKKAAAPQLALTDIPVSPAVANLVAPPPTPGTVAKEAVGKSPTATPIPVESKPQDAKAQSTPLPAASTPSSKVPTAPVPASVLASVPASASVPSTWQPKTQHQPDLVEPVDTQTPAEAKLPAPRLAKKEGPEKTAPAQEAKTPDQVAASANNDGKQDVQASNVVPEAALHTLAKAAMTRQLETGLRTNPIELKATGATSQKARKNLTVLPEISTNNIRQDVETAKPVSPSKPTQSGTNSEPQADDANASLSVVSGNPKATPDGEQPASARSENPVVRDTGNSTADAPTSTTSTQPAPVRLPNQPNPETAPVMPGLSNASLVDRMRQSELNFGMRTGEFGRVEIRTQFSPHEMSARIFVDRSEMGHALRAELPGLQKNLSELDYSHPKITVLEQSAASHMGDERHSQRQQPTESPRNQEAQMSGKEPRKISVPEIPSVDEGLSIRI